MNWAIGNIGTKQENNLGVSTPSAVGTAIWESHGTNVLPRSLYLQQLQDRLGVQAVANIISPSQDATLNDNLAAKAGTLQTQPRSIVPTAVAATAPDVTDNGGATAAQFENTSKASENYPSVFDNSTTTKYYMAGVTALWLRYQSPVSRQVVAYTLTSANDVPERDPKDWKLTGSNDALTWTTLDIRSGQTFTGRGQTKSFSWQPRGVTCSIGWRLRPTMAQPVRNWPNGNLRVQPVADGRPPKNPWGYGSSCWATLSGKRLCGLKSREPKVARSHLTC